MRIGEVKYIRSLIRRSSLCQVKDQQKQNAEFPAFFATYVKLNQIQKCIDGVHLFRIQRSHVRQLHVLNAQDGSSGQFSVAEARKLLNSKGMVPLVGNTCLKVECPTCRERSKATSNQPEQVLYINLKTGHCHCPSCRLHGSWENFVSYLNDRNGKADLGSYLNPVSPACHRDSTDSLLQTSDLLSKENISEFLKGDLVRLKGETLEKLKCRVSPDGQFLFVPVTDPGGEVVTFRTLNYSDGSEACLHDTFFPLILQQKTAKEDTIVTCNLKDALYCFQELKTNVVCLPAGLSHLPQETLPYLEPFPKLTLWFGGGVQEWEAARLFAKKLNEKDVILSGLPTSITPGPSVATLEGLNLTQILKTKMPMFHDSVTTFSSLKDEVYAEVMQVNEVAGIKWKRFTKLCELMKGFRRGELTVFTGPTGAGKTTFISEYSLDLCMQKVNTLWGSFEIRNVRLAKMMLTQFAGVSLEANPEKFNEFAGEFEKLPLFFLTFHGQQDIKSVMEAINHATYVHDIGHVIVDNLQFMMGTGIASSDRMDMLFLQDRIIGAFRQFATSSNVHVTLVIHPRKEDISEELTTASVFGSAKATQEADNVLILQDRKILDPGGRKKYLQIAKNRFSGDLGIVPLSFDRESLSFAKKKPPKLTTAWESAEEKGKQPIERRRKSKIAERLKEYDEDVEIS